jgi:hypothetical protein
VSHVDGLITNACSAAALTQLKACAIYSLGGTQPQPHNSGADIALNPSHNNICGWMLAVHTTNPGTGCNAGQTYHFSLLPHNLSLPRTRRTSICSQKGPGQLFLAMTIYTTNQLCLDRSTTPYGANRIWCLCVLSC